MLYFTSSMKLSFKTFSFTLFKTKSKRVLLDVTIFLKLAYCISVLYKHVLCVLYLFCCIFSKEKNNLITGERKLEEQWLGLGLGLGLFFVLYFS